MARAIGAWWIKDGIDGRRLEAQGFASTMDAVSGFDWTEDHGDSGVLEKDFVETANYDEKVDKVDAMQMSSHGNPNGFAVWGRFGDDIGYDPLRQERSRDIRVACVQPARTYAE